MVKAVTLSDLEAQNDSVRYNQTQTSHMSQNHPFQDSQFTLENIKNFLFAGFSFKTFIFAILIVQVIAFIVEISVDRDGVHFMAPVSNTTLEMLGGFSWNRIKNYHLYSFFISPLYNYSFFSLLTSILCHALTGFRLEAIMNKLTFISLYISSGIIALLCSGLYQNDYVIVGSYYQCCAMIGAFGCYVVSRSYLQRNKELLFLQLILLFSFFVMLIIPYNLFFRLGELAGFLTGCLIELCLIYREGQRHKYITGGIGVCIISLIIMISYSLSLVFYMR